MDDGRAWLPCRPPLCEIEQTGRGEGLRPARRSSPPRAPERYDNEYTESGPYAQQRTAEHETITHDRSANDFTSRLKSIESVTWLTLLTCQVGAGPISDRHLLLWHLLLASLIMSRGKKEKVTSGLPCVSNMRSYCAGALHTNLPSVQ